MRNLKLIIWSVLALYWQILIAPKFSIMGMLPNFLIPYIIFIHLRFDLKFTLPVTFILGVSIDLLQPSLLGLNTITFLIISYLVYHFHHPINKKRLLIVFTSIFLLNLCYYVIFYLFQLLSGNLTGSLSTLYIFTLFYNTILSFLTVYLLILMDKIQLVLHA
jgi:rod shape-determining protein MreD